ncbi:MAG: class IV adenylate cyclase [Anaerolineaceae bacterium]
MVNQEIEVKFMVADLAALEVRLRALGAKLVQPRVHEVNLRFDTPDESLSNAQRVLRLRKDQQAHLTYKGPSQVNQKVNVRQEIELLVDDFDNARRFLEALGYEVNVMYEKFRTTYKFRNVLVTLDEMPYGAFTEIEGPDAVSLEKAAEDLWLDWSCRSLESYMSLFGRVKEQRKLDIKNLSFDEVKPLNVTLGDLGLRQADLRSISE